MNIRRHIDKKRIATFIALGLLGTPALAANTDTLPEERRGVVIGSLIGASVGGPIGAGAGAIIGGALVGKTVGVHRINRDLNREMARDKLERSKQEQKLKAEIASLNRALNKVTRAVSTTPPELPIQFRTDSTQIETHYQDDLVGIAEVMAQRPEAKISLSGFADRRGSEGYNQRLSEQRVRQVKAFLVSHGVAEGQIETSAFGESRPLAEAQTPENDFFDRRVVMRFSIVGEEMPFAVR